jgi:hypothetical protein
MRLCRFDAASRNARAAVQTRLESMGFDLSRVERSHCGVLDLMGLPAKYRS